MFIAFSFFGLFNVINPTLPIFSYLIVSKEANLVIYKINLKLEDSCLACCLKPKSTDRPSIFASLRSR